MIIGASGGGGDGVHERYRRRRRRQRFIRIGSSMIRSTSRTTGGE